VTDDQNAAEPGQRCVDFVEMLTDYLDRTLTDDDQRRVEEHLRHCAGCRAALAQWRTVKSLAGRLVPADVADIDPFLRERLISTFLEVRRR
jgi:anti-sigma factor RsiW